MTKPFDPDAILFNVECQIADSEGPKWVVIFDSLPKEDADARAADLKRRPLCDPQTVRVSPRHYQG